MNERKVAIVTGSATGAGADNLLVQGDVAVDADCRGPLTSR